MNKSKILLFILALFFGATVFYAWHADSYSTHENVEEEYYDARKFGDLVLEAAYNVRNELVSRHNWIEPSREVMGKTRQVLARMGDLNPEVAAHIPEGGIIRAKIKKGETLADILAEIAGESTPDFINAAARVLPLKSFRAGRPYKIIVDTATGRLQSFEYEINDARRLIIEGADEPSARIENIEYLTLLDAVKGEIDDNLFQAVADIGENPQLASKLVELFGAEINFVRDLQKGDKFAVLIEKRFRDGELRTYGRILAARFTNKGKTFEAFLFRDNDGMLQHYNGKGENLKKNLLMAPLSVTRLTSHFTHDRKHPISGERKPHLGVDYSAPPGTPVKAVGSGEITKKGWGGGYGNQIIISHGSGLESMYGHLSGFARGIAVGKKVKQGQVIGFVGSTGLSTGPHLDFRLRQNGTFINPVKVVNPRSPSVDAGRMAAFRRVQNQERAYLTGKKLPDKYNLDSIVPPASKYAKTGRSSMHYAKTGVKNPGAFKALRKKSARAFFKYRQRNMRDRRTYVGRNRKPSSII